MDIQQINETLYRIPIPVPFPLKYVYCYLFKGEKDCTIVDAGFNYPPAQEAWKEAFHRLGVAPSQVSRIYITHFHPDHFGLAGWLQELTGAMVFLGAEDFLMTERVWFPGSIQSNRVKDMCRKNGVPEELAEQIKEQMEKLNKHVLPLPNMTILKEQHVLLGDEFWKVIHTPGHSDGHLCFYQPEKRILIAADHILDKITPNISLWPGCRTNPLQDYLDSLQRTSLLDVKMILPGHGKIITDMPHRIQEILQHHEQRIEQMFSLTQNGAMAYEVANAVFGHKELNPHQWRFAMAETLAHLEFLAVRGSLIKTGDEEEGYVYGAAHPQPKESWILGRE